MIDIDITVAASARVYDYLLGGTNHFAVDREVTAHMAGVHRGGIEAVRAAARADRDFLDRTVRYMVTKGVRQFLDIGCGIPTSVNNTHEVAQLAATESRVVYVDYDAVVLAHAHKLRQSHPAGKTAFLLGDLRTPEDYLSAAAETLDLTQPIAVMLLGILDFVRNDDNPSGLVTQLLDAVAPDSYLAILHRANDIDDEMLQVAERYNNTRVRDAIVLRSHEQVCRFFDGVELVEPGVVRADRWHPDETSRPSPGLVAVSHVGVGCKL